MDIFAHRGRLNGENENTLETFNNLVKNNFKKVEFDIRKTSDDILIVFHDKSTKRLGNKKLILKDSTHSDIKSVIIHKNDYIPSLNEVLDVL